MTGRIRAGRLTSARVLTGVGLAALLLASSSRAGEPKAPQFTVMTYNVNWSMPGAANTLKAIRGAGADIVCLQETTKAWEQLLGRELKRVYPHSRFSPNGGPGGLGILSKWPVEEIAWVPTPGSWFPAWVMKVETPIGHVQILNVHLRPALDERGRVGLKAFLESQAIRRKEIEHFHSRLKGGLPTLALGDFNEDEAGGAVTWLVGKGFADVLKAIDPRTPTWHGRLGGLPLVWRLDHILYSKGLSCVAARVIQQGGSDHYPVLATFERPKEARPKS